MATKQKRPSEEALDRSADQVVALGLECSGVVVGDIAIFWHFLMPK